ncbi:uncharacterized protein [Rutidosis leptorrhynchoides]|uniref:uncharacterized protein n=1 Tax=Rutidosis leptorrhynchoides TaxID=125765 RepID=UPI003A9A5FA9
MIWIKWDDTLLPYKEGGLNIGSLRAKNLAILGKWIWAKTEPNSLWVKVLKSIHGSNGLLLRSGLNGPQGKSGVWINILRAGLDIEKAGVDFSNSFKKVIGDGSETYFWDDAWLCDIPWTAIPP